MSACLRVFLGVEFCAYFSKRQEVQPRLLARAQEGVQMRALQEDLLERQRPEETTSENIKCQLLHEREAREKLHKLLQARETAEASSSSGSRPEQEEELSLTFSQLLRDFGKSAKSDT